MAEIHQPFTQESAMRKVKAMQALWNAQDAERIGQACVAFCWYRHQGTFMRGREEIVDFLAEKWRRETRYKVCIEPWAVDGNRIAVQFWSEFYVEGEGEKDGEEEGTAGQWWRCYGLEDWTFTWNGFMLKCMMSGNDVKIDEEERWFGNYVDSTIPREALRFMDS
ncbi:hypothetical protein EDC01DRAFT_622409 [Geopyxis carbonaria]|nr:hypothetical protein EDC01DRAFT_622409 [Geopyxis carbonaria]